MPEVDKTPDAVRFGLFELSVETGELRKNGVRLRLSGQPIEVLILLVKTPGKLVTREELQRHLWREDIFTDFEKGLNAAVNRLREYLGDSATDPKYIETVPGRGYRFIAKVKGPNDGAGPGKTVSHYRILEVVGRGGMGVVYKAQDLKLSRYVALKFLPEESATNHEALERFRHEATTASSLNHPNICTIYEIEEHEGQPFIVMELLQGQTLRECLISSALRRTRLEPALDLDQLLDIALQVLDGLQAAHEKGIIHRDIKPANIFVTNGRLVKILDFGLAKLVGTVSKGELETRSVLTAPNSSEPPEHLSEVGAAIGTFGYMAPEQARGEDLDARADLFSFGLVVYEMATGRPAFNGTTPAELCHAILTDTPVPIHQLNPSVPPALEQVINKALDKDREQRYQSATELRADLVRVKQAAEARKVTEPEWPITQQETRFLEAAAPKEATVGRSIEVMAMVRENESTGGLREFLRTEQVPHITAEDVRERSFEVEFPLDEKAKPQPLDITLRLEAPGFDPQTQIKKLKVPPCGDSQACTFLIIPRLSGELVINLELLNIHEQVLASRSIRTHALPAGATTSADKIVVTIPLTLVVRRIGGRILEMVAVPATEASLFDEVVRQGAFDFRTGASESVKDGRRKAIQLPKRARAAQAIAPTHKRRNLLFVVTGILMILVVGTVITHKSSPRNSPVKPEIKSPPGTSSEESTELYKDAPTQIPPVLHYSISPRHHLLNTGDTAVLADFTLPGGPAFNGSGNVADPFAAELRRELESELKRSPTVHLLAQDQVRDTLKMMDRKRDEPLIPELAQEVCLRANCKAVLNGSVALDGNRYRFDVWVIDSRTSMTIATAWGETDNRTEIPKLAAVYMAELLNLLTAQ